MMISQGKSHRLLTTCFIILSSYTLKDVYAVNLCPSIEGCRCSRYSGYDDDREGALQMTCSRVIDPDLQLVSNENITRLTLSRVTINNLTVMAEIRRMNLHKLSLYGNNFGKYAAFDWAWIPDSVNTITLTRNGFQDILNSENGCNFSRMQGNLTIYIADEELSISSLCLPGNTKTLSISNFQSRRQENSFSWPSSIKHLDINNVKLDHVSAHLFESLPTTLKLLTIRNQNLENSVWLRKLPTEHLTHLMIRNCKLTEISPELETVLKKAVNLKYLALNQNRFKQMPKLSSSSIEQLHMQNNEINYADKVIWANLPLLKQLNLQKNQLSVVPIGMPETLQTVNLGHNQIEYSHSSAFNSMFNLTMLDLSWNKLQTLPSGIRTGIKYLFLQHNNIFSVTDTTDYVFCEDCAIMNLAENPLSCNIKTIRMLSWLQLHNVTTGNFLNVANCIEEPAGLGKDHLYESINYMKYMNGFNKNCSYEVDSLSCDDVGLHTVPTKLPSLLSKISITKNPKLTTVNDDFFASQQELKELVLDHNNLSSLPYGLPSQLKILSLRGNKISNLTARDIETLSNLTSLKYLYLEENHIKTLHAWQFKSLKSIQWVGLSKNPLLCDCTLLSFVTWYSKLISQKVNMLTTNHPTCSLPSRVQGYDIRSLQGYYMYKLECVPAGCSWDGESGFLDCSAHQKITLKSILKVDSHQAPQIPSSSQWTSLNLSGLKLNDGQINYRHLSHLETIDLSDNLLSKMPVAGLPDSIKNITMDGNSIMENLSRPTVQKNIEKVTPQLIIRKLRNKISTLNKKKRMILKKMMLIRKRLHRLQQKNNQCKNC